MFGGTHEGWTPSVAGAGSGLRDTEFNDVFHMFCRDLDCCITNNGLPEVGYSRVDLTGLVVIALGALVVLVMIILSFRGFVEIKTFDLSRRGQDASLALVRSDFSSVRSWRAEFWKTDMKRKVEEGKYQ